MQALHSAALAVVAAAVALTCASERSIADMIASKGIAAPLEPAAGVPPSFASAEAPAPEGVLSREQARPELAGFHAALTALDRGERTEPVRISWIGDSHTAADYMTGAVRSALWKRYTPGGPGFVRVGVGTYRHDRASSVRIGRFRVEPVPPSRRARQGDGVFGLGGMRATALTTPSTMTLKIARGAIRGHARFTVLFDLPNHASFEASVGGRTVRVPFDRKGRRVGGTPILRLDLEGAEKDVLELRATRGRPRFYGVVAEGSVPGVVLDTLGINGARIATSLSWEETSFVAEVAERRPSLVVVAYGTNEAFDGLDVRAYAGELASLLGRLRNAAPSTDCLVLGPPDALETGGLPAPRVAAIGAVYADTARKVGCAFVSGQNLMGGPGSFLAWLTQSPPLARSDRIHLTPAGYRALGERIASLVVPPDAEPPIGTALAPLNSP